MGAEGAGEKKLVGVIAKALEGKVRAEVEKPLAAAGADAAEKAAEDAAKKASADAAKRAAEEAARRGVTGAAGDIPKVADTKLGNFVRDFTKGVHNPTRVGSGSTADAVRHELQTGAQTAGKGHVTKAREMVSGLTNWLRRNPSASAEDRAVAQGMLDDLNSALGGN